MRRRLPRRLLLLFGSTLLTLAGLEVGLRWWRTRAGPTTNPYVVQHHERLGWSYVPGVSVRHSTAEFDVEVAINEHGLRDVERGLVGGPCVMALGDSFTFGWGVEAGKGFCQGLQRRLGLPVYNFGVSGYGTDQELLQFREWGPRVRPSVVVLTFCGNDVEEVLRGEMYGKRKPRFVSDGDSLRLTGVPVRFPFLEKHSFLVRFVRRRLQEARWRPLSPDETAAGRLVVQRLLRLLAAEVHTLGAVLVVASFGEPWLERALQGSGIHHLDLTGVLEAGTRDGRALTFSQDGHWNEAGHEVVAEALAAFLRGRGLAGE